MVNTLSDLFLYTLCFYKSSINQSILNFFLIFIKIFSSLAGRGYRSGAPGKIKTYKLKNLNLLFSQQQQK